MTDHKRHTKGKRNEFNCAQLLALNALVLISYGTVRYY